MTNINSVICPDLGRWRAWLDHEDGSPRFDEHLASCPACQRAVAELRQDAALASSALGSLPSRAVSEADTATARERLAWRQRATVPPARASVASPSKTTRLRIAAGGLAAAMLVSVVVALTPEGRTAAAAFLAQFRSRQVVAVEVSPQSQADISRTMSTLSNLGTLEFA